MRTVLAVIVSALLLLGALGFGGYELHKLTAEQVQTRTDLDATQTANASMATALAAVQADRAADAKQLVDLAASLKKVADQQQDKRRAQAKVVANANPTDKALLASPLPAATLRLFNRAAAPSSTDASN